MGGHLMSSEIEQKFETHVVRDVRVIRMPANMPDGFEQREPYRRALARLIEAGSEHKLIINMNQTPFYDSMSVGVLVAANRQLRKRGIECRFCNISQQTRWAIETTQLDKVLAVFDDEAQALEGF